MPSGARKRKAKKKKQAQSQNHGNKEDSGNELELENEPEQEQELDHGHEEDPITPKTPVQSNEGEEKEKNEVEGGSSDAEEVGSLDHGYSQNHENHTPTSFQEVESTDINLVVGENGGSGLQNEVEVSSGGVLEEKDGPTENLGPLIISTEEGQPKAAPVRTSSSSSSSSSSDHVRDEIHDEEKEESRTDVGVIALDLHDGDESEISSSNLVVVSEENENEPNQTLGPSTKVDESLPSPKDNNHSTLVVDMEAAPSEESESSDGDESKLDVVSTMATLDANESIQSVGSVDSPRSVHDQQCLDQVSNDRAEGFSETAFQELGSQVDFLNTESGDYKHVYKVQNEAEEDFHDNSLSEESLKGLRNEEDNQVSTESVSDYKHVYKVQNEAEEDCHDNSEESLKGLRNEEDNQVSTESVSDNYAIVMEQLNQVVADLEENHLPSSASLATAIEESEAIPKVDEKNDEKEYVMTLPKSESVNTRHTFVVSTSGEAGGKVVSTGEAIGDVISTNGHEKNDEKESVMPLPKSESVNTRHTSVVSTNGEAGEKVVSTVETIGDVISTTEQANQDVVSAGGEDKDGMGLIKVQGTSADPNEISDKEIASHPRNGTDEKKINLAQRESRTSWLNCCGIVDLFTSGRS